VLRPRGIIDEAVVAKLRALGRRQAAARPGI